jgi:hypothetical protein
MTWSAIGEELIASIYWTGFIAFQAILVWFFKLVACLWVLSALGSTVIWAVRSV